MTTAILPALLTPDDVAQWLSVPRARVLRMVRAGTIPHVRLPTGDIVFDAVALAEWIAACVTGEEARGEE